jgi:DNA-binding SARP family transcriptional activator/WD40 repeat protein
MRAVDIGFLGPLQVDRDANGDVAAPGPRDRVVLSALAVRPGEVVAPDRLADALWGDEPPVSWPKVVQGCVARLRRTLGAAVIETAAGGYRLTVDGDHLDTHRFEELVERARKLATTGAHEQAAVALARALALWRGRPFEELDRWPPGRNEATRLEELRRAAEEDLLDARLAASEHRQVVAEAEVRVAEEPLRERRWAILALAQYRCGRQADALRSLHRARSTLADQLGIDPGPELVALEAAILAQDPALAAAPEPPAVADHCPYKGLAPYDVGDAEAFFGRDGDVAACLERLSATPLLVVTGPSGCGKSSLVRAGVMPALQRRGHGVVVCAPGTDPDAALTQALAAVPGTPVLVIDQMEELFTPGGATKTARAFCRRLATHATDHAPVVVAVRADHLADLAAEPAFARLAEQGLHLVSPLAGDALRAAIEGPATRTGLRLEQGLVDLLVRDTEGEPGALPLLSHALAETWQRRDGRVLTVEGYKATGGIRGAVARSADRLYESLPVDQRTLLRSVLLRLVAPTPDGEPVRSRIASRTLSGDAARERVLGLLVRARLVTAEEDTVELAHEALARAWPRLRSWLDEDAAGQRVLRHLAAAADGWESLGRPDTELYRGGRLESAFEWRDATRPDLTALETAFLDASMSRAAAERETLAWHARHQARQNRRLRGLLAAAVVFLAGALLAGAFAVSRGRDAGVQRDAAELEALVNRSLALRSTNRGVAALLAVEAYRRAPDDARAHSALLGTFTAAPSFMGYQYVPADAFVPGALVPDTPTAVVARDGRDLALLDLESGELDDRFPPADDEALDFATVVRVSADGRFVAQLVATDTSEPCFVLDALRETDDRGCAALSVYELATGRRVLGPVSPPFGPGDLAISGDGSLVAVTGGYDGDLAVYRTARSAPVATLAGLPRPDDVENVQDTAAVAFAPDGRLYLGSMRGPIRVVEPATAQVVATIDAPPMSSHNNLVATGDGLLVGSGDQAIVAVDASTGSVRWSTDISSGHSPCYWLAVAERVDKYFCANLFGLLEERDLATGQRTGVRLDPQLGSAGVLEVTADGRELVAFGNDAPVITRWRLDGSGPVTRHVADGWLVEEPGYDPSGEMLLVRRRDSVLPPQVDFAVWDPVADSVVDPIDDAVFGARWAGPDTLAAAFADGTLGYYDVRSQSRAHDREDDDVEFPDVRRDLIRASVSAGGTRLYVGLSFDEDGRDARVEVWTFDTETGQRVDPTIEIDERFSIESMSATHDGAQVVVTAWGSDDDILTTVHDGRTGEQIGGPLPGQFRTSVSPDGLLVGGDMAGAITLFDLDTLAPLGTFPGVRGRVHQLQFSADGTRLVAGSESQILSIYDVATRTRLGDPISADAPLFVWPGALRADGEALAINDPGGVAVWDLAPDHLADAACRLAGRNLTRAEWDTYLAALGDYRPTCPER